MDKSTAASDRSAAKPAGRWLRIGVGLLARMPFWLLYRISDLTFLVLYFLVRYRRKVVDANLASSFPDMAPRERARVRRQFYLNFTDY
ncbi:MAG: hypothetical protein K2L62_01475, partial [Muribaculaceae bacterium]|nr:hypothetical protein [Muribaculaceae bacterium]